LPGILGVPLPHVVGLSDLSVDVVFGVAPVDAQYNVRVGVAGTEVMIRLERVRALRCATVRLVLTNLLPVAAEFQRVTAAEPREVVARRAKPLCGVVDRVEPAPVEYHRAAALDRQVRYL